MKKVCALLIGLTAASANAGFLPYGIQVNTNVAQVTNDWGWTPCFTTSGVSSNISYQRVLQGCQGNALMMAIRASGSETYNILGAASYETVTRFTDLPYHMDSLTGNDENGISWYLNNYSWGFTSQGNQVNQYSADTNLYYQAWNGDGDDTIFNQLGLSYHSNANGLRGGWAFNDGNWTALNSSYERVWLTSTVDFQANVVSEPLTGAMLLLGLAAMRRSRRNASKAD